MHRWLFPALILLALLAPAAGAQDKKQPEKKQAQKKPAPP